MSRTTTEINSQPDLWEQAAALAPDAARFFGLPGERVLFLGCGTSEFVGYAIARLREKAGLGESDVDFASEWVPGRRYDRIVAITRSGTTSEVLDALRAANGTAKKVAIVAVAGQPVEDLVDETLVLDFADETSVVQTRFPTSVITLARAVFGEDVSQSIAEARAHLSRPLDVAVGGYDHFVALGSGWTLGLAHEAGLKIREAAQAWAEAYPLLDSRHGPIAVATDRTLVSILGPAEGDIVDDVKRTGADVLVDDLDPLVQLIRAQRLAVALAEHRGLNPDTPRGLTRSVILG